MEKVTIEIQNNTHLDRLLMSDKEMQKKVQKIVKKVLKDARNSTSRAFRSEMGYADIRHAYKAVRAVVYKRILGGNINILASRKASRTRVHVQRDRKLDIAPHQRGGNRRPRSQRTDQIDSYYGADRGFVLRFLNAGTSARQTRYGNRGSISARGWFGQRSKQELEKASETFTKYVDELIQQEFG